MKIVGFCCYCWGGVLVLLFVVLFFFLHSTEKVYLKNVHLLERTNVCHHRPLSDLSSQRNSTLSRDKVIELSK